MKKYYTLLLFAMLGILANAQTSWDGTATTWTKGDGTNTNPYLIENGQHLAYLSEQVRNGETYKDICFKLADNLDMGCSIPVDIALKHVLQKKAVYLSVFFA